MPGVGLQPREVGLQLQMARRRPGARAAARAWAVAATPRELLLPAAASPVSLLRR